MRSFARRRDTAQVLTDVQWRRTTWWALAQVQMITVNDALPSDDIAMPRKGLTTPTHGRGLGNIPKPLR